MKTNDILTKPSAAASFLWVIDMQIEMMKTVPVDVKTLKLHLKVRNSFTCGLYDQDNKELKDYDGYVPDFMPGQHYGDYVILDIDVDSGQITNWVKPSAEQMQEFINKNNGD